jgi:hypothetical protein
MSNVKIRTLKHLRFGFDLTFELWHLKLKGIIKSKWESNAWLFRVTI